MEFAACRMMQEALTITLKHADATRSTVVLRFTPNRFHVEVTYDGSGAPGGGHGAGLGLLGMRERVDVLGGTLVVPTRDGGGFEVRATLLLVRRKSLVGGKERGDGPGAAGR